MILFVFEGKRREPDIFKTIEYLYFPKGQTIICSFGNNIYELYRQLNDLDGAGDIVSLLREHYSGNPDSPFAPDVKSSDFSEIYLFFDYDFQNKNLSLEQMNARIAEMLLMFDNETDTGKLYINYPMIEAIRYTKTLPDADYINYTVSRKDCQDNGFKYIAQQFSAYGSLDFLMPDFRKVPTKAEIMKIRDNWNFLKRQNIAKAVFICTGSVSVPDDKDSISQQHIFSSELEKFVVPTDSVSILSAFPLFLFDYFKS